MGAGPISSRWRRRRNSKRTLRSPIFDGLHVRQLRNRFTDAWDGHWDELQPYPVQRLLTSPIKWAAHRANLKEYMNLAAGAGSGLIRDLPSAAEVLDRLVEETVAALASAERRIEFAPAEAVGA